MLIRPAYRGLTRMCRVHCSRSVGNTTTKKRPLILGVETSSNSTGLALIDSGGNVLGEKDIDGVAVTVKPGISASLAAGLKFATEISEAHKLQFPYLVLSLSGDHGVLALARGVDDFVLLGTALDTAPGFNLDKLARRLKLHRVPGNRLGHEAGGRAIELTAMEGKNYPLDPFDLRIPRDEMRDCNFSFTGTHMSVERLIERLEKKQGVKRKDIGKVILPMDNLIQFCVTILYTVTRVSCDRTQRAFEFLRTQQSPDFPYPTALVLTGGVGANTVLRAGLVQLAQTYQVPFIAPPPRLCVNNGVMNAWNGLLLHRLDRRICTDPSTIAVEQKSLLGIDCRTAVREANIKLRPFKLTQSIFDDLWYPNPSRLMNNA